MRDARNTVVSRPTSERSHPMRDDRAAEERLRRFRTEVGFEDQSVRLRPKCNMSGENPDNRLADITRNYARVRSFDIRRTNLGAGPVATSRRRARDPPADAGVSGAHLRPEWVLVSRTGVSW